VSLTIGTVIWTDAAVATAPALISCNCTFTPSALGVPVTGIDGESDLFWQRSVSVRLVGIPLSYLSQSQFTQGRPQPAQKASDQAVSWTRSEAGAGSSFNCSLETAASSMNSRRTSRSFFFCAMSFSFCCTLSGLPHNNEGRRDTLAGPPSFLFF